MGKIDKLQKNKKHKRESPATQMSSRNKIGKPQKSKKHKKLKTTYNPDNPFETIKRKKGEKDLRPDNEGQQEIPRKVKDIMRFQKDGKGKKLKKVNEQATDRFKMVRSMPERMKPAPVFVQCKNETERDFLRRVDMETHRVLTKAAIEDKYKVQITDDGGGTKPVIKREKSERKKQKDKERKKKKKEGKIMKQLDRIGDFAELKDAIEFGETVVQPPSLTALPRRAKKEDTTAKPGKRSLLLKQMMDGGGPKQTQRSASVKVVSLASRQAGQTVKRKMLSPAQQQISDFQRNKAIEQYRQTKQKKPKEL